MKLGEFFQKAGTKKIVINTDIDGFLSGMILQKYYGCEVVGFSNSKESIWLKPDVQSILSPIYIDIFVNRPEVFCIDQHIVAYDNAHIDRILAQGTKLNPNLDVSRRTYIGDLGKGANYYCKYPFGTVHYLIALMKQDGIDVEFNGLDETFTIPGKDSHTHTVTPGQIILRADDALFSSANKYIANCNVWWANLQQFGSRTIDELIAIKNRYSAVMAAINKGDMSQFFQQGLGCDGSDGSFDTITEADGRTLQRRIVDYTRTLSQIIGIDLNIPTKVIEHRGEFLRCSYSEDVLNSAFTYAFISSPSNANECFCYTCNFV